MVKSSILFVLFLGAIFAQQQPAYSSSTGDQDNDSDADVEFSDSEEDLISDKPKEEDPILTCTLFKDIGCNAECSIKSSAFSINSTGKCTAENVCQCTLERDTSLEGLFRARFNAEDALQKIKQSKKLSAKVLEVLQNPYQTDFQAKMKIREVAYPAIYTKLIINDKTPAFNSELIEETDDLNLNNIKTYVTEKLQPILISSAKKLKTINYTSRLNTALKNTCSSSDEKFQSIANEVRRTENVSLISSLDTYIKSNQIDEKPSDKTDDFSAAISHIINDQFAKYIDSLKQPTAKKNSTKRTRKATKSKNQTTSKQKVLEPSSKKTICGADNPKKEEKPPQKPAEDDATSSGSRFELVGFDKNFLDSYKGKIDKKFQTNKYFVKYQRNKAGDVHFIWKKGNDKLIMNIRKTADSYSQYWDLADAKISLRVLAAKNIKSQTWNFGKTECDIFFTSKGKVVKKWAKNQTDEPAIEHHKALINEWCAENDFLLGADKKYCTLY